MSVEVGTTNKDFLDATVQEAEGGREAHDQGAVAFPKDTDAAAALKTGKVDAYFGDSPVVAYYIAKDKSFAFAGAPINPIPVGIAHPRSRTRR